MINIFFFFIAIILYVISPDNYDFSYCFIIFCFFCLAAVLEFRSSFRKRRSHINFSLFFTVSFFFVNFFYPIFVFPVDRSYFLVFDRFYFNDDIITKSTALAFLGFMSFLVGKNNLAKKRDTRTDFYAFNFSLPAMEKSYSILFILTIIFNFILYFQASEGILNRSSDAFFEIEPSLLVINQCLVNLLIFFIFYLKKSFLHLWIIFLYVLVFLYVGDRGSAIQTCLIFLFCYNFFYKIISRSQLIVILVIGFVGLSFVSIIRGRDGNVKSFQEIQITSSFDFAMDLVISNRNLYAGYEFANKNGLNYGKSSLPYIFAPIPLLPTFITTGLFDARPQELSSGTILTNDAGASWGLGTNLIADLYMQFAEFGVVFFMGVFGYIVSRLENKLSSNPYLYLSYITLFSFSIYMARSSMFDSIRYIFWTLIVFYIVYNFINRYVRNKSIGY